MFELPELRNPAEVIATDPEPLSCNEIRKKINAIDLYVQLLQERLQNASPGEKPTWIKLIDEELSKLAQLEQGLETCVEEPIRNVTIVGVERTQATQFFRSALAPCPDRPGVSGPCTDNAIPLVTGKPTILRVYVDTATVFGQPTVQNLTGVLETKQESSPTNDVPLTPYNAPIVGRREFDIQRLNSNHTLNFRIPASRCRGRLKARVTVFDPSRPGEFGYTSNTVHMNLDFVETKPIKIRLIRVRYDDPRQMNDSPAPTIQDFWTTIEYVLKTYPIPAVELVADTEELYDGDFTSFFASGGPGAQGTTGTIFEILGRYRAAEGLTSDVIYFALIPSSPNMTGAGGWALAQRVITEVNGSFAAQELGHLCLGNPHAPCGTPADSDLNYPVYGGYPSGSIGEIGFDFVTSDTYDPALRYDFMSYCRPTWVSPYNYERLLRCYRSPAAAHTGGPFYNEAREVMHVSLTIYRDARVTFHDPILVSEERFQADSGDRTPYLIELHGDRGILNSRRILRTDPYRSDDDAYEDFVVSIPSHPNATQVKITCKGEVIGSYDLATYTPEIEMRTKVGSKSAILEWKASCGDAPVNVLLRYSPDQGRTWRLIGTGGASGQFEIDFANLPGSDKGIFEGIGISQGRMSKVRSDGVEVASKPKQALILSPANGSTFRISSNVYLYGAGQSLEGSTPPQGLKWKSDIDGYLGQGAQAVVHTLSPGWHTLTLEADDGAGGVSMASVSITVEMVTSNAPN